MLGYVALPPKEPFPLILKSSTGKFLLFLKTPSGENVLYGPLLRTAAVHRSVTGENARWLLIPIPLPRARWSSQALEPQRSVDFAIQTIDVATTALVNRKIDLDRGQAGTATLTTDRPGFLEIAASAPGRQLLVVSESITPVGTRRLTGSPRPCSRPTIGTWHVLFRRANHVSFFASSRRASCGAVESRWPPLHWQSHCRAWFG